MPDDRAACYACRLSDGTEPLPGGRIWASERWVVEHCTGPLGVGTLILKPLRHCTALADLSPGEAAELGPLLQRLPALVQHLTSAVQVYACLWSHAGWEPVHIHFLIQPAFDAWRETYSHPGPTVQLAMFEADELPPVAEVEAFCERARQALAEEAPSWS